MKIQILLFILIMLLSACVPMHSRYDGDRVKTNARLEQVIKAIENKDEKSLKSMFSKRVLEETEDIDSDIEYLFNFVQGDIESWVREAGGVSGSKYYNRLVTYRTRFKVTTDKETYIFLILEYPTDKDNPDNVGVYMLQVIKEEDKKTQFDFGFEIVCPGIYRPEKFEINDNE